MHTSALTHLSSIQDTCAKQQTRLTHLSGVPAKRAVEDVASCIVQLIKECHDVALQVCTTKVKTRYSNHFKSRRVNNLRKSLQSAKGCLVRTIQPITHPPHANS